MFHPPTLTNIFSKQHESSGLNLVFLKSSEFHTRMWQNLSPNHKSWLTSPLFLLSFSFFKDPNWLSSTQTSNLYYQLLSLDHFSALGQISFALWTPQPQERHCQSCPF